MKLIFLLFILISGNLLANNDTIWVNIDASNITSQQIIIEIKPVISSQNPTFYTLSANGNIKNLTTTGTKAKKENSNVLWIKKPKQLTSITYETHLQQSSTNFLFLNFENLIGKFTEIDAVYVVNLKTSKHQNCPSLLYNDNNYFDSYFDLINTPFLLGNFETKQLNISNTSYNIYTHSDYKQFQSHNLIETITPLITDLEKYIYPIKPLKRDFVFCFLKQGNFNYHQFNGGAANHKFTVILMPLFSNKESFYQNLNKTFAHEFLHQLTPYQLFTNKTFVNASPQNAYSAHMWLYEGVTEYLSWKFLLNFNYITEDIFKTEFGKKIAHAKGKKQSLIRSSTHLHQLKVQQNGNIFYTDGAIAAFVTDILINEKWNGEKDLLSVIQELIENQSTKGFNDDFFIAAFEKSAGPSVGTHLRKILDQKRSIKTHQYFKKIGWKFYSKKEETIPTYGIFKLKYNFKKPYCVIENTIVDELGFLPGDEILAINHNNLELRKLSEQLQPLLHPINADEKISIAVLRNNQQAIYLEGKSILKAVTLYKVIDELPKQTKEMKNLKSQWLN